MASIGSIVLCIVVAIISMTAAVPVPSKPTWDGEMHMPLQWHRPSALPWENVGGPINFTDSIRHPFVIPHHAEEEPSQSPKLRRQNSFFGKMAAGAVQGFVSATTTLFSDHISDELTGNDKDHPQKTKEQLEAEKDD